MTAAPLQPDAVQNVALQTVAKGPRAVAEAAASRHRRQSGHRDPDLFHPGRGRGPRRLAYRRLPDHRGGTGRPGRGPEGFPRPARGHREAGRRRLAGHGALRPAAGQGRAVLRLWRARQGPGPAQHREPADRGRRGVRHRTPRHHRRLPDRLRHSPVEAPTDLPACWTSAAAPTACWPSPRRGPDRPWRWARTSTPPPCGSPTRTPG